MWITRLELRNIKSYDENGQVIEFKPGVNLIRGENGAGKSTMLEAIGFALFDSALYHQERFVREGAGKGQIVVGFVSARDEREYQVVRGVRGGQIYIYDPELNLQVCDGKKDVFDFIFNHLSVEPGTKLGALFQDAIGVPQGTMTAVFLEDSADRKNKFSRLLRVDEYEAAYERLRETGQYIDSLVSQNSSSRARLEGELGELPAWQTRVAELVNLVAADHAALNETRLSLDALAVEIRTLDDLKQQIDALQGRLRDHQTELARLEERLAAAAKDVREAEDAGQILAQTETAYLDFEREQRQLEELRQEQERLREGERLQHECDRARQRYDEARQTWADFQDRLERRQVQFAQRQAMEALRLDLEREQEMLLQQQAHAEAALSSIARDLQELRAHEDMLDDAEARCPVCRRPMDEHTRADSREHYAQERRRLMEAQDVAEKQREEAHTRLKEIERERKHLDRELADLPTQAGLDDLESDLRRAEADRDRCQQTVHDLERALALFGDFMDQLAHLQAQIDAVQQRLAANRPDHDRYLGSRDTAARLEARREVLAQLQAQYADLEVRQAQIAQEVAALAQGYDAPRHAALQDRQHDLREEMARVEARLAERESSLKQARHQVDALLATQERLVVLEREAERLEWRKQVFNFIRAGVRNARPKISQWLVRSVAAEANRIFGEIMGDSSLILQWDEDYNIRVEYRGEERDFKLLSGGEQMAAAIAVRLALLTQVTDIRFAFFDEPTTNLDDMRREQLAERLASIRSLRQLFVITHDDTFERDTHHVIEVRKVNGVSRVETF